MISACASQSHTARFVHSTDATGAAPGLHSVHVVDQLQAENAGYSEEKNHLDQLEHMSLMIIAFGSGDDG